MNYYIGRYCHGLWIIRRWLPLVFLPSVVYLLSASAVADRFSVSQKVAVHKTAPIALSRTPVDFMSMAEVISRPSELFLDDFAVMDLAKHEDRAVFAPRDDAFRDLKGIIEAGMTLKSENDGHVIVQYYGPDADRGKSFVNYYAQRLISRSKDGVIRSMRNLARAGSPDTNGGPPQFQPQRPAAAGAEPSIRQQPATLEGEMEIRKHLTLWRFDRLFPSIVILLITLGIWFFWGGIAEWIDPSFKTERHISRYLDAPVIGVMPDLEPLIRRMLVNKSSP